MFTATKHLWIAVTLACVSMCAAVQVWRWTSSEIPNDQWNLQRMSDEMAKLGYKSEFVDSRQFPLARTQGLYLARESDSRTWNDIAANRPKSRRAQNWDGLVVVSRDTQGCFHYCTPEERKIGAFIFFGDPQEIDRIARHFD
jgi:hypothetical protein